MIAFQVSMIILSILMATFSILRLGKEISAYLVILILIIPMLTYLSYIQMIAWFVYIPIVLISTLLWLAAC